VLLGSGFGPQKLVATDRKTNLIAFIYSDSSTNPANLLKIGPVDVEITGLTEIVKE